jgi:hypothetical protein
MKGIYAGLLILEDKCIEIDRKQAKLAQPQLNNEQQQALIALSRTLLHEHYDFFLSSQHPSASPALRKLATKYAMPARMWRHGIHSFLELLQHRLPESLDHTLAFIYLAYSMMALLYDSVPAFEDTWIECLGDLGRYRIAIEDADFRDRDAWTSFARRRYSRDSGNSSNCGRLYPHLANLDRPNTLQQLFHYVKSLCLQLLFPFISSRESFITLSNPTLNSDARQSPFSSFSLDMALLSARGLHFPQAGAPELGHDDQRYLLLLDETARWVIRYDLAARSHLADHWFERVRQAEHICALLEVDAGEFESPRKILQSLIDQSLELGDKVRNRSLLWVRLDLATALISHDRDDDNPMLFDDFVISIDSGSLPPPSKLTTESKTVDPDIRNLTDHHSIPPDLCPQPLGCGCILNSSAEVTTSRAAIESQSQDSRLGNSNLPTWRGFLRADVIPRIVSALEKGLDLLRRIDTLCTAANFIARLPIVRSSRTSGPPIQVSACNDHWTYIWQLLKLSAMFPFLYLLYRGIADIRGLQGASAKDPPTDTAIRPQTKPPLFQGKVEPGFAIWFPPQSKLMFRTEEIKEFEALEFQKRREAKKDYFVHDIPISARHEQWLRQSR